MIERLLYERIEIRGAPREAKLVRVWKSILRTCGSLKRLSIVDTDGYKSDIAFVRAE